MASKDLYVRGFMQDAASEPPRISIPGTPVNRGIKEGQGRRDSPRGRRYQNMGCSFVALSGMG
jgi:hypothetical protein